MIKCAIFDADGTLLDSMEMWREITYDILRDRKLPVVEGLHHVMNKLSVEQCAQKYIELGVKGSVNEVVDIIIDYAMDGYRALVPEKPHALDFVRLLHENEIRTAVATASDRKGVAAALERLGFMRYVDVLLSCPEVGKSKEHPDIFLRCAESLGASVEESVVFEDSYYALRTAKNAGFAVIAVEDGSAEPAARELLKREGARYISDYAQLIEELTPPEDDFAEALRATLI